MIQNGADSNGQSSNGREHLKQHQWKPGQSGNPKGRPKVDGITKAIQSLLAAGINGESLYEAIAKVAIQKALQGDSHFWQYVIERSDGKVADNLNQSGEVEVVVRYEDAPSREN